MAAEITPDDRALRTARRRRALQQMEAHDLDVLVLGRQANVRYVTGAPQLWIAGTRPFGPVCVVVRATGEIHLNSTWDEGIPEEIGRDHLYGLAWNPLTLIAVLKNIDGASTARRVGTDAISPTFAKLLPSAFPNAELVDAEPAMGAARRIKTSEEIAAMSTAVRVAEAGIAAAVAELQPEMSEKTLAGAVLEAMAAGGVSTPATQDAAWVTSREHPWRRANGDGRVRSGDLVALAAGALAGGYLGEVGRTFPVGRVDYKSVDKLYQRSDRLWDSLFAVCRPGAPASSLLAAYDAVGEPLPAMPVAHGLGLGFDPPVVSPVLSATAQQERLDPGMILALTGYVWQQGVGAVFGREVVVVTDDGAQRLTKSPGGP
ncbi:M24 family metallopeptidase [Mycobacterium shimoidei]|uniref:Xaa-Pro aminopeptidase [Anaerobaculum mobile DSM] n=1 Tax=Mycobacterium shimoidei TaxID=29313 RepID=A0A1E3TJ95_MYCSH|nr:M24 family metallopeptidase [Mycobacterium shimoidei]MCV7257240.1 M24 family metallopeptidase [Mycobacterium shimoidei]ODR14418.1 Xaa-Pro aminopeptidase [Mycobacterium shimoidei]ORW80494.1 Xaa-Pro aminopeptidase [Mycobacterium shimoidei]SRX96123.1 Xaa-Pro aminopeptidase [Anaerobaculum mobile DSM] [Mycobacterium shimoidei]